MATRLQLRIYVSPGEAQLFCNLLRKDGIQEKITVTVDTGAEVSLLPDELLDVVQYRLSERERVQIGQAGIARQDFDATEAYITVRLEDDKGNITPTFEVLAWFAPTKQPLIGFEDVLDRAVLHIDMPQRTGWLEIES
jgi:hypothetical protein